MPTSDTLLLEIIKSYTRNIHSIILNKKTYSVFLLTLFFTLTPNLSAKPAKRINIKILVDTTKLQENIDSAVKIDTTLKTNVLLDNLTKLQILVKWSH